MDDRWRLIDCFFRDNGDFLVNHHLSSYDKFFTHDIKQILRQKNPVRIQKEQNPDTHEFHLRGEMYIGGKDASKVYYGKPVIYDDRRSHFMYPNEARLRNMTYGLSIHVTADVVITEIDSEGKTKITEFEIEDLFSGEIPDYVALEDVRVA